MLILLDAVKECIDFVKLFNNLSLAYPFNCRFGTTWCQHDKYDFFSFLFNFRPFPAALCLLDKERKVVGEINFPICFLSCLAGRM